jgi:hypothetical protein
MSFPTQHIYKFATSSHSKPGLFGTTTLTLLLPWFVDVLARNSRTWSSKDSRSDPCLPVGSCVSMRLSPEPSLHQVPESAIHPKFGLSTVEIPGSRMLVTPPPVESRFPNSAHSRIRDFAGPRLPRIANFLLLKNML